ncbi:MAG TPA: AAA family ATPase [Gemmatimonadaceae bacterium]|nr:AAA family ATPase [Gemmatimonadaceae bacterium]
MTRGLVLGKFLPYHAGHAHLVRSARTQVDELVVLVCSLPGDPIPGALRYAWVRESHPDCRVVHVGEEVPQAPEDDPAFWPVWTALIARRAGRVDVVFTSEAYGDELARRLGARHVCVDRPRRAVPVSGTAVRADPLGQWDYIPEPARPWFARRVAVVGPESAGKTTLAERLAADLGTAWVPEFARAYTDGRDSLRLTLGDLEAIGWGQAAWEDEAARRANRVLVCDTELHTTCTWSDLLLGARPPWLTAAARGRPYDLFLLLDASVPWADDGTRVLRDRRADHLARLRRELDDAGRRYVVIGGGGFEARRQAALAAVREAVGWPRGAAGTEALRD